MTTKLLTALLVTTTAGALVLGALVARASARLDDARDRRAPPLAAGVAVAAAPGAPAGAGDVVRPAPQRPSRDAIVERWRGTAAALASGQASGQAAGRAAASTGLGAPGEQADENARLEDERAARDDRRRAALQVRLAALAADAHLSDDELKHLSAFLAVEQEQMGALFDRASETLDARNLRDQSRALRAITDENVQAVLVDPAKRAAWAALRDEDATLWANQQRRAAAPGPPP